MRYLGIDYGSKKVGTALSDEAGTMGFPHAVYPNSKDLIVLLTNLINEKRVESIVIGESRNFDGELNPIAEEARTLANELGGRTGLPVYFEPETFTTQEARRFPDGTRMPGSPDVDASAAALILTAYLERQV